MNTINTYNFTGRDEVVSSLKAISAEAEQILDYIISIFDWHKSNTVRLNAELLQAVIGKKYKAILAILIELKVLVLTHTYNQYSNISRGYRLTVNRKEKKGESENKFLSALLNQLNNTGNMKVYRMKCDLAKYYYEWAKLVTFDKSKVEELKEEEKRAIDKFIVHKGGSSSFSSKCQRHTTTLNQLNKKTREAILINGNKVAEVDAKSSVWQTLYHLEYMMPNGLDGNFKYQIQFKDIYSYVQYKLMLRNRKEAKDALNITLNAGEGEYQVEGVKRLFPKLFAWVDDIKKKSGNKNAISQLVYAAEAKAIFNISLTLSQMNIPNFTIHDGILVEEQNVDIVKQLMLTNNIKSAQK